MDPTAEGAFAESVIPHKQGVSINIHERKPLALVVHTLVIVVCYLNPNLALKVDKGEALVSQGLIYEFVPPKDQFCFKVLVLVLISNLKRDEAVQRAHPINEVYVLELKPYF